jgi:NADPH:quinone reductase-like Zn-dependent oxidoreductase
MAKTLPTTMRAARFASTAGGLEKHLKLDASTPLPKDANALPPGSTLVKVAYAGPNPVDYKLPELGIFRAMKMSMPAIVGLLAHPSQDDEL